MNESKTNKTHMETYAIVGELVLLSSALDHCLTEVIIEVLDLGSSYMLLPTLGTIDSVRKIEILKERAHHIAQVEWKNRVMSFIKKVESVFKHRNIACHTPAVLENGQWTLKPYTVAKVLKKIDLQQKKIKSISFNDLQDAIHTAESALGAGRNLIDNFKRLNVAKAEKAKK